MEKSRVMQQTLWELQRRYGRQALEVGIGKANVEGIATGLTALDALLYAGGIGRRRVTEMVAVPTSGLTSLALNIVARAQETEATAVYIDLEGTFDPDYAARCGIDLERLMLVRPSNSATVFEIAYDTIRENIPALVVLDEIGQPLKPRTSDMRRISDIVVRSNTALLVLRSLATNDTLEPFLHTRLHLVRSGWTRQSREIAGYQVNITIRKDKGGRYVGQSVSADIPLQVRVEGGEM